MTVLTNAPPCHSDRILAFLNIRDLFLDVYDVVKNNLQGKPHPDSFRNTLAGVGHTVEDTLFLDDYAKYAAGYEAIGGKAVLVSTRPKQIAQVPGMLHIPTIYGLPGVLALEG
jgi:HAD superfamily hydrolase (TIGR01509 family)